jgi:nucleotide-binding universal stress UspA family protein
MAPNIPQLLADLVTAARARLEELKVAALETGLHVTTMVLTAVATGRPADSICEHAATEKFDLIVMGTHGRTGLSHTLMGSVAERVVRKAPCPVLTVRETTSHAQKEAAPVAVVVI